MTNLTFELQGGREQLLAEIKSFHVGTLGYCALQGGREQLLAEMSRMHGSRERASTASMRPRATARGNGRMRRAVYGRTFALQGGREQLLAEMAEDPPAASVFGELQGGREQLLAEMAQAAIDAQRGGKASMRPRATARGNGCGSANNTRS